MNKQEAILKLEDESWEYENYFRTIHAVELDEVRKIISQIDEPQKVTLPKFAAEWIEERKHSGWHLQKVLSRLDDDEKVGDWAYDENDDLIPEKAETFARAWIDGYEVEEDETE